MSVGVGQGGEVTVVIVAVLDVVAGAVGGVGSPWRDRDHLEAAVLDWVHWFNTERTHESIDDFTPVQAEEFHYRYRADLTETG